MAQHLVEANLVGHDSHGVGMLPFYLDAVTNGKLTPNQELTVVKNTGSIVVCDGGVAETVL